MEATVGPTAAVGGGGGEVWRGDDGGMKRGSGKGDGGKFERFWERFGVRKKGGGGKFWEGKGERGEGEFAEWMFF